MKKQTAMGDTILPREKRDIFSDKLESMTVREALDVLYYYYGFTHLLSEECYENAVENGLIEKLW